MSASTFFTIVMVLVLLRIFWLRIKAAGTQTENFKLLSPKEQLAVLKECLLNNPTEKNLQNLGRFIGENGLNLDVESYRPLMKKQLELSRRKDALVEDNELYTQESRWMDQLEPLEFADANISRANGNIQDYIAYSLEGISRLYSDEAIENALKKLALDYPKANSLLDGYHRLVEARDLSLADEKSLQELRKIRDQWEEELLKI